MSGFEMSGEASIEVAASPDEVYALVSDIPRMGEWSPECRSVEWVDTNKAAVGAQFNGRNERSGNEWTTPNTVMVADPGKEFTWVVGNSEYQICRWTFRFEPAGDGTRVTESFELGEPEIGFRSTVMAAPEEERPGLVEARTKQLVGDMEHTLRSLKEAVERS